MLVELAIHNFAIIDAVRIEFQPGLNVLTGETGAGKSILIDALGAVLGGRVSPELVRTGARRATVDATIDLTCLRDHELLAATLTELELDGDDGLLLLSREIHQNGRSVARLNGRPTTAALLSRVGSLLVDIHGQSDHLSLLRPRTQLDLLDRYAKLSAEREAMAARLGELRRTRSQLAGVVANSRDRAQRVDLLRFQVEEIERAQLRSGEESELATERARLANAERLALDASEAYTALAGDEDLDGSAGSLPALRRAAQLWTGVAGLDSTAQATSERMNELVILLEDIAAEVRAYRDLIEIDPPRLGVIEERLDELRALKRKYGEDVPEILAFAQAAQEELEQLTGSESDAASLAAKEAALVTEVSEMAAALSAQRQAAAADLAAGVERAIADLNMGSATFQVSLAHVADERGVPVALDDGDTEVIAVDETGIDRIEFMIAPNAGESAKPLARIASGGETARLMLALKSVLSDADETPTLIFDEIDVGVGGRSGQVVGEKLWTLSAGHQVVVITHLPQIAAYADAHFRIAKADREGRTVSVVDALATDEQVAELAAMVDGLPLTEPAIRAAQEMLGRAAAVKHPSRHRQSR